MDIIRIVWVFLAIAGASLIMLSIPSWYREFQMAFRVKKDTEGSIFDLVSQETWYEIVILSSLALLLVAIWFTF